MTAGNETLVQESTDADGGLGPEFDSPFWKWFGITLEHHEPGLVRLKMTVQPQMMNRGNLTLHGGVSAALVDSAVAAAITTMYRIGADIKGMSTTDLNISYLEGIRPDSILQVEARVLRRGRTIVVGEAEVRDQDNRLCAVGRATYMLFR